MNYAKYIDIPNWISLRDQLIRFKKIHTPVDALWWCHFENEVKEHIPELIAVFESMGLHMHQLIFFTNLKNDLNMLDHNNPSSMFIHTDRQDDPDSKFDDVLVLTDFPPTNAINIPMEYCEDSLTLFYELIDDAADDVYYPTYNCGGHDHANVKEVFRFELNKPAVLRINVPHAVHNPHNEPRVVATFRFRNDIEYLLN
jgi:hypothetical protein